jgi:indoleamine 2,3-dioxygenase
MFRHLPGDYTLFCYEYCAVQSGLVCSACCTRCDLFDSAEFVEKYRGVREGEDLLLKLNGGSAAQSTLLHAIDCVLSVRQIAACETEGDRFLSAMLDYMPKRCEGDTWSRNGGRCRGE